MTPDRGSAFKAERAEQAVPSCRAHAPGRGADSAGRPRPVSDAADAGRPGQAALPPWLDRPLSITLRGPGGGSWLVATDGSVAPGSADSAAQITGVALEFRQWGTRRTGWRDSDVSITGDSDCGAAFLDIVNIV